MIGSPIVFHTAPPQPSSKAFMTWYPVFVGGPDASQKGLGDLTPQKSTLRSGMSPPWRSSKRLVNSLRCCLAVSDSVDHFASAVHTITAREVLWIAGLHGGFIHLNSAV